MSGGGGGGSGYTPDGTGLDGPGNTGDGQVTIEWTEDPGCDAEPPPPTTEPPPDVAPEDDVADDDVVAARPPFTG